LRHFIANGGTVPATAIQVVEYLAQFAGKLSASTLERRLIAIHQAHVVIAALSPTSESMGKRTMQGIRRTFGTKQRQVRPMVKDDLLCTTAAMAGMPLWQIKLTTGHKSDVTLSKYIRPVNRRKIPSLL